MNIFCLSIDGLQNAMLGTYGNAWIQTPALNRLAAQSVVFDQYYTPSLNLWDIFDILIGNPVRGTHNILLTDDSDVLLHPRFGEFSKKQLLETSSSSESVHELENTQIFKAMASAVDLYRTTSTMSDTPSLCWLHLNGFRGIWDFPLHYREIHRDDEDPEPYKGVELPNYSAPSPDELQAVLEAYSGGVAVLDDVILVLLNLLENNELGETIFVLMGTRGFSLGEHHRIGANDSLYSENLHLPLIIRFPRQEYATVRVPRLVQPQDLAEWFQIQKKLPYAPLFQCVQEETVTKHEPHLYFHNESGETAILTPEWFLRRTENNRAELYVKPDDRFEVNDVADRREDVAEELLQRLERQT